MRSRRTRLAGQAGFTDPSRRPRPCGSRTWSRSALPYAGGSTRTAPDPGPTGDMADIIDLMLATGCRIGEILALRWSDLELDGDLPVLTVSGTIKTETGKGTYRKSTPKSTQADARWCSPVSPPSCYVCAGSSRHPTRTAPFSRPATAPGTRWSTSSVGGARSARTPGMSG
ncbi:hypothetical protein E7Z54_06110 [Nocardioides sp.]|nr:hypothetical protein E7Z54_06110 [Nocardioides sp.]